MRARLSSRPHPVELQWHLGCIFGDWPERKFIGTFHQSDDTYAKLYVNVRPVSVQELAEHFARKHGAVIPS